jgi:hypothetical protein
MPILGTVSSGYVEPVYTLAQTFNASGNYTVPAGVSAIAVYVHGSSGAGFTGSPVSQFRGGHGGGGGSGGSLAFLKNIRYHQEVILQ